MINRCRHPSSVVVLGEALIAVFFASLAAAQTLTLEEVQDQCSTFSHQWVAFHNSGPNWNELDTDLYWALVDPLRDFVPRVVKEFPREAATKRCLDVYSKVAIINAKSSMITSGNHELAKWYLKTAADFYNEAGFEVYPPLEHWLDIVGEEGYLSKERLIAVKPGMTMEEVEEVAGIPLWERISIDEERDLAIWEYPTRDSGVSASIYFKLSTGRVLKTSYGSSD